MPQSTRPPAAPVSVRQLSLYVVPIVIPCVVLVALSLRMISQERELAGARRSEERRRLIADVRDEFATALERIRLRALAASASGARAPAFAHVAQDQSVALIARVVEQRLVAPWEDGKGQTGEHSESPAFARLIARGESAELTDGAPLVAAAAYRQAVSAAPSPSQAAYARLLLARALAKAGRGADAAGEYGRLLRLRPDVVDDHGVPFTLYAAQRLLDFQGASPPAAPALDAAEQALSLGDRLSPSAVYMLHAIAQAAHTAASDAAVRQRAVSLTERSAQRVADVERTHALQRAFPALQLAGGDWVTFGEAPWLVSLGPPAPTGAGLVVAVRARPLFASLDVVRRCAGAPPCELRLLTGRADRGEPLGPGFPGLRVSLQAEAPASAWAPQQSFYVAALLLVVSLTLFGAYLLWRDVRREMRLAEMRSQFVSSVSHELKTPLTAIRMFAETLRMGRPQDPATRDEYLDTIVNESERLTRLLNNVLDFSKIEQGRKSYSPVPHALADIVQAAARAMHYPLAQQGFELQVELDGSVPPARVDPDAIEQAILNLLTNALKYSGEGRRIGLRLRREGATGIIEVTDCGIGIPPHEQSRIFDKFYRVDTPENQRIPGTGLGLTLVQHIARAHGGAVTLQSAPGAGSTFALHVPLVTRPGAPGDAHDAAPAAAPPEASRWIAS